MEQAIKKAKLHGFSHIAPLDTKTLVFMPEVRDMCAADRCHKFNRSWMCPPGCGSLEDSTEEAKRYSEGIIVQTTGALEDVFDYEAMQQIGKDHMEHFRMLRDELKGEYPNLLALGAGGCDICESCSYPDAPCRAPDDAIPSMEAYGLLVSKVCEDNGLGYYYGEGTVTYTSCFLLR